MKNMRTPLFSALSVLLVAGCADEAPQSGAPVSGASQGNGELHLPLEPVTHVTRMPISREVLGDQGGRARAIFYEQHVELALGDGYPTSVTVELDPLYVPSCGPLDGDLEIKTISGGGETVTVGEFDATSMFLVSGEPGAATLRVEGEFRPADQQIERPCWSASGDYTAIDFELDVLVHTRRVVDIELAGPLLCDSTATPAYFTGASLEDLSIRAVDANSEPFYPSNASSHRPASIRVTSSSGAGLALSEEGGGLTSLQPLTIEDTLEVALVDGAPHPIEILEPKRITSIDMSFDLPSLSSRRIPLETGETYGDDGFAGIGDRIMPSLNLPAYVDDVPVCSKPPIELFELTSSTPMVCTVEKRSFDDYDFKSVGISGTPIDQAARLRGDGMCALRLAAPTLDEGQGLSAEIEATFVNVSTLIPMD